MLKKGRRWAGWRRTASPWCWEMGFPLLLSVVEREIKWV